ncbi:MAG TPA: phosphatase PAP2 family protein [Verrucomicrobiae bacterium]
MLQKKSWLLFAVFGIAAIVAAFVLDGVVDDFLRLNAKQSAYQFAACLSKIGDWTTLLVIGLGLVLLLHLRGRREMSHLLLVALVAGMLAGFSATIIRSCTGRTRPSSHTPQGFYGLRHGGHWIVGKYEFGAFPSGHTATVAGLTMTLWLVRRRWAAAFGIFAVATAWSRIALNCHHFSDVAAAAVWGIFVGAWLFRFLESRTKSFFVRT